METETERGIYKENRNTQRLIENDRERWKKRPRQREEYTEKTETHRDREFKTEMEGLMKMYRVTSVFFSPFPRISVSLKKV
jgi:hypothetical protein